MVTRSCWYMQPSGEPLQNRKTPDSLCNQGEADIVAVSMNVAAVKNSCLGENTWEMDIQNCFHH